MGTTLRTAIREGQHDVYFSIIDTIAALYPNVVAIDLMKLGWNAATMLDSDNLHPNDLGLLFIAGKITDTATAFAAGKQLAL